MHKISEPKVQTFKLMQLPNAIPFQKPVCHPKMSHTRVQTIIQRRAGPIWHVLVWDCNKVLQKVYWGSTLDCNITCGGIDALIIADDRKFFWRMYQTLSPMKSCTWAANSIIFQIAPYKNHGKNRPNSSFIPKGEWPSPSARKRSPLATNSRSSPYAAKELASSFCQKGGSSPSSAAKRGASSIAIASGIIVILLLCCMCAMVTDIIASFLLWLVPVSLLLELCTVSQVPSTQLNQIQSVSFDESITWFHMGITVSIKFTIHSNLHLRNSLWLTSQGIAPTSYK